MSWPQKHVKGNLFNFFFTTFKLKVLEEPAVVVEALEEPAVAQEVVAQEVVALEGLVVVEADEEVVVSEVIYNM